MSELNPEMRKALDDRGDNRMSAYYFDFDTTGSDAVNDVLAAVAFAGKAFHSTEQWGDDDSMPFTMVDLIQATANEAADHIEQLTAERDEFQRLCGMHDPTGADHMEDAARLADENDELRAENGELAAERDAALTDLGRTQRELDVIHGYIPVLRAERDTLAEIVAIISPRVERDDYGLGIVAGRNFYADSRWTEADGERFRAVLDRIYREAETDD